MAEERQLDITQYAQHNFPPSAPDVSVLHAEISSLTANISYLRSQLQRLEARREKCRAVISPLRRMPIELLQTIFRWALPTVPLNHSQREMVIALGLVCKRWREATLLEHRLWAGIQLKSTETDVSVTKASSWLKRSGTTLRTLEYRITRYDHIGEEEDEPCHCYDGTVPCRLTGNITLSKMLLEGPRVDRFKLDCDTATCFQNWITHVTTSQNPNFDPRPWDNMRSLELAFSEHHKCLWEEPQAPPPSLFHHFPSALTSLCLDLPSYRTAFGGDYGRAEGAFLEIPPSILEGLKTFKVSCDWDGAQIFKMLPSCTSIETLSIEALDFPMAVSTTDPGRDPRILLPKVKTLSLYGLVGHHMMTHVATPSLRNLTVGHRTSWKTKESFGFRDLLWSLLRASWGIDSLEEGTFLDSLRLKNVVIDVREFVAIMASRIRVRKLIFDNMQTEDYVFLWEPGTLHDTIFNTLESMEVLQIQRNYPIDRLLLCLVNQIKKGGIALTLSYKADDAAILRDDDDRVRRFKEAGFSLQLIESQERA